HRDRRRKIRRVAFCLLSMPLPRSAKRGPRGGEEPNAAPSPWCPARTCYHERDTAVKQPTDLYWDPYDVDLDTSPYDTWRRLRDEAPVYRNDRFDFYALSRYADVHAAHRDAATF